MEQKIDGEMVKIIDRALTMGKAMKVKMVFIHINSPGGNVFDGMRIAQLIERSPVPVVCEVDGLAASMALYVLQSCHLRLMTEHSLLMAHEPSISGLSSLKEHETAAKTLKVINHATSLYVARKMGMSVTEYEARIHDTEWWLSSEEALAVHAVDMVVPSHHLR